MLEKNQKRCLSAFNCFVLSFALMLTGCSSSAPTQTENSGTSSNTTSSGSNSTTVDGTQTSSKPDADGLIKPTSQPEITEFDVYGAKDYQMSAQLVVAQKKGYFKDAGLNVNIKWYQSASEIPPAMISGDIKIGFGGWANPMQIASLDYPVRIVAPLSDLTNTVSLVARPGLNINSIKDIEGKKIVMLKVPIMIRTLQEMTNAYGVDFNKLNIVNAQPSDALAAFLNGDVDLMLYWLPFNEKAIREGNGKVLLSGSIDYSGGTEKPTPKNLYISWASLFVANDFIEKNPNTMSLFMWALGKAQKDLENKENVDQLAELTASEMGIDVELAKAALLANKYDMKMTKGWVDLFSSEVDFYAEKQVIRKKFDAPSFVDPKFIKKIAPEWSDLN